jgi:glutamate-ammonia-ligase adenylyltransferase
VADIEAMKRQIHAFRGHQDIAVEGHNIKLGRGGIREIEFFVQTQQLIAGGRHPELRGRDTLSALDALVAGGWIDPGARNELAAAYRFLRAIEHRLQMVADDQTHTLPADREDLEGFARFAGFADRDALAEALLDHLRKVQRHYVRLFEDATARGDQPALSFPANADDRDTLNRPGRHGLPPAARGLGDRPTLAFWFGPAFRGEVARAQFSELLPVLLDRLAHSENPDAALTAFDQFIGGVRRGGRLFALLRQNPDLVTLVALTLGTAPRLADILARRPEAMDALLEPTFFGALPDEAKLDAELNRTLGEAQSYEEHLDRPAPVQPGAHVPDRRPYPVWNRIGGAGGGGFRPALPML